MKEVKVHRFSKGVAALCGAMLIVTGSISALLAQLSDVSQTPNLENEGIKKSLEQQIGSGRGDNETPDSSIFLIQRDPFRSIMRGRQLFQRKFTHAQGFGPRIGDGGGDIEINPSIVAGQVDSCAGCHSRPHGSAGVGGNVFTRPDSRDAPHLFGLGLIEMLADEITSELRAIRQAAIEEVLTGGKSVTIELVSKGIHFGQLTVRRQGKNGVWVDTSGVRGVDPDLRVKPFFAEGSSFSIRQFVVGAFNDEMGLEAFDPDLLSAHHGERVVTPSGMVLDGSMDVIAPPPVFSEGEDGDGDGVANEIDVALVDHMEFYLLNYFKPGSGKQNASTEVGFQLMEDVGCNECHVRNLVVEFDRRVADVETVHDPLWGIFNRLFATAVPLLSLFDDGSGHPAIKEPSRGQFLVQNIFADFRRHDIGPAFHERNFDGSLRREFITEPLWGVGSTAPYGHDGRSINLEEVILRHGGEAEASRNAFSGLPAEDQDSILRALESLVLFPPPDTASNLDPGDPSNPDFPQRGHGSIRLQTLFNDPTDPE